MLTGKRHPFFFLRGVLASIALLTACSCSSIKQDRLPESTYTYQDNGHRFQSVSIEAIGDSLKIVPLYSTETHNKIVITKGASLMHNGIDLAVVWSAAKFRQSTQNLPQQLNTEVNGNFYVGWRWDRYKNISLRVWERMSLSLGLFGGIGTTKVSPSTTNHRTTSEYQGAVASYGVSMMTAVDWCYVGLAVGVDNLMSGEKNIWIYQNRPWYGLTLGVKIN